MLGISKDSTYPSLRASPLGERGNQQARNPDTVDCHEASASRNDKRQRRIRHSTRLIASLTLAMTQDYHFVLFSCHCERVQRAWQSTVCEARIMKIPRRSIASLTLAMTMARICSKTQRQQNSSESCDIPQIKTSRRPRRAVPQDCIAGSGTIPLGRLGNSLANTTAKAKGFCDFHYRFENCGLRRAFFLPYFLRSTVRESRVSKPSGLRIARKARS